MEGNEIGRYEEEQVWRNMGREEVTGSALSILSPAA